MIGIYALLANAGPGRALCTSCKIAFFTVVAVISLMVAGLICFYGSKTMKVAGLTFLSGAILFCILSFISSFYE